jgi:hypothetical protein
VSDQLTVTTTPTIYYSQADVRHTFAQPRPLRFINERPDFGGIDLRIAEERNFRLQERTIYHDYHVDIGYNEIVMEKDDEDDDMMESYYAFDDDVQRNPYVEYDDPDIHLQKHCRRTNWHRDVPLNCHALHEFDFLYHVAIARTKGYRYVFSSVFVF